MVTKEDNYHEGRSSGQHIVCSHKVWSSIPQGDLPSNMLEFTTTKYCRVQQEDPVITKTNK